VKTKAKMLDARLRQGVARLLHGEARQKHSPD
jgi:hypothetical protein